MVDQTQNFNEKPLMIVPAAGLGSRVQFPESKEMLLDENSRPLMAWSLDLARLRNWPVHVIIRPQKLNLAEYLRDRGRSQEIYVQEISGSVEWPHSLLLSRAFWRAKNIVVLPDTRWEPRDALDLIDVELSRGAESCYGTFQAERAAEWGVVSQRDGVLSISEKCGGSQAGEAWGLIGFRAEVGVSLLAAHLNSHLGGISVQLPQRCGKIALSGFEDLTRQGWPPPSGPAIPSSL